MKQIKKAAAAVLITAALAGLTLLVYAWSRPQPEADAGFIDFTTIDVRAPLLKPPDLKPVVISAKSDKKRGKKRTNGALDEQAAAPSPLGELIKVYVEPGSKVKKGQLLAEIDPQIWLMRKSTVAAQQERTSAALALLEEKKDLLLNSLARLKRRSAPFPPGTGAASAPGNHQAAAANQARKALKQIEQALSQTRKQKDAVAASLAAVQADARRLKIHAPVSGTITEKTATKYELIYAGQKLFTIAETRRAKLKIYLPPARDRRVRLNQPAAVVVDSFPRKRFSARVQEIEPKIKFAPSSLPSSEKHLMKTGAVILSVNNKNSILKKGMPADAYLRP